MFKKKVVEEAPKDDGSIPVNYDKYIAAMQKGTEVIHHRDEIRPKRFRIKINDDITTMTWQNVKKIGKVPTIMKDTLFLVDIKAVTRGQKARAFKAYPDKKQRDETSFTILYEQVDGQILTVSFVFTDDRDFNAWYFSLRYLSSDGARAQYEMNPLKITLEKLWLYGDKQGDGSLDVREVKKLVERGLNLEIKKKVFKALFKKIDYNGDKTLDKDEFVTLVWELKRNEVVDELWVRYSGGRSFLTTGNLQKLMGIEQGEVATSFEHVEGIVESITKKKFGLSKKDFTILMTQSSLNSAFSNIGATMYQNMDRGLNDYYIHCAANANEVPRDDDEKTCMYNIAALLRNGVRALHIPLYQTRGKLYVGNPKGQQQACAPMADVMRVIKDGSFLSERLKLPVIILFELHLTVEMQRGAVKIIKDQLGFAIDTSPEKTNTPFECAGKFLIGAVNSKRSERVEDVEQLAMDWEDVCYFRVVHFGLSARQTLEIQKRRLKADKSYQWMIALAEPQQILRELSDGMKFDAMVALHYNILTMVIPRAHDKTNHAMSCWAAGCQLVGVNYHMTSHSYHPRVSSRGKFSLNGNTGFVLKPRTTRNPNGMNKRKVETDKQPTLDDILNARKGLTKREVKVKEEDELDKTAGPGRDNHGACKLVVRVISGQQIPRPKGEQKSRDINDPFVSVVVDGCATPHQADKDNHITQAYKTQVVSNNSFTPQWNETFEFELWMKEHATIIFRVFDSDTFSDQFICERSIPVAALNKGYRTLFLRDFDGEPVSSAPTLFLHISETRIGTVETLCHETADLTQELDSIQRGVQYQEDQLDMIKKKLRDMDIKLKQQGETKLRVDKEWKEITSPLVWFNSLYFVRCFLGDDPEAGEG